MPPKEMAKVTLKLSDGTKIVRLDSLTTVQDFLEEHQEFVKVVRCRDCKFYCSNLIDDITGLPMCGVWSAPQKSDGFCNYGEAEIPLFTRRTL